MIVCVSNSNADPMLISKKWINSLLDVLDAPSAMLAAIDTADLLI